MNRWGRASSGARVNRWGGPLQEHVRTGGKGLFRSTCEQVGRASLGARVNRWEGPLQEHVRTGGKRGAFY